jgi:outer membrane receptor protein involved in Fe transport
LKLKPLFFLFLLTPILGYNQEFSILGKVLDEQGSPIAFANVILMTQNDSTVVNGTSTDDNGFFKLNAIIPDTYDFRISYIGFKEVSKELLVDKDIDLGTITLQEETQNLDEVSLVYKKPTFKKEADRLVFDVENSALVEGNILQVLKSTPGVLVINNTITIKNITPTVFINNRKVNISSFELAQLLENSSANSIKAVEVITNPSAKYDASSGVVLNIIMSKNLVTGYRGNVFANYEQGVFPRYNTGMSHFFKSEKINLYANYSYSDRKENRDDTEDINYLDDNQTIDENWQSYTNRNKWTKSHNININFDYNINDKNTLSLSTNMLFLPYYKYKKSNITNVYDSTKFLDFYYNSNSLQNYERHNMAFDLDFEHQFSKGKLSINTHITDYDDNQNQDVISNYFEEDGTFIETTAFNSRNDQHTKIFAAKADYNLPISETSSFETGLKSSHIETNSATLQYDIVNGQEILDPNNTDDFDYKEYIQAAYINYSEDWEKWSIILGLRTEQTNIKSNSIANNQTNNQNYLEWFPTTSITYKPAEKFSIYTNYKRSINRPNYQDLNPFRFFNNDNSAFTGNPYLKPEIFDHFVFGTSISDHFAVEAYYINSKNNIRFLPIQDYSTKILFYTPVNIDKSVEYGFDFSANFNVAKDWAVYFVTSFYNIDNETDVESTTINQNLWSNYSILQNDFTFLEDRSLNINLSVYYVGKNLQGFRIVEDRWVSSLSVSKSIMAKKVIISLTAEDLFNTQDYSDSTRYLNQSSSIHTNLDNRFIKLGLRYNFGNTNLKANSQTKNLEERERLKENN